MTDQQEFKQTEQQAQTHRYKRGQSGCPDGAASVYAQRATKRAEIARGIIASLCHEPSAAEQALVDVAAAQIEAGERLRAKGKPSIEADRLVVRTLRSLGITQ
jgi:hypothetical protein